MMNDLSFVILDIVTTALCSSSTGGYHFYHINKATAYGDTG